MDNKLYYFFTNSFLKPLLLDEITDITYNGKDIYYQTNDNGKLKSDIKITTQEAFDFIRQIANMSEKLFCISSPTLDVSIRNYRINAVHSSIGRNLSEKVVTFAIRKTSKDINVNEILSHLPHDIINYLKKSLEQEKSIILCGSTGCGKTEFQKFLISQLPANCRVLIIDSIQELSLFECPHLDLTYWQIDNSSAYYNLETAIENSLRFNPDWTIVAESRGKEMNSILNSALTGHPIITTMHAKSLDLLPERIIQMILQNEKANRNAESLKKDVLCAFNIGIHLKSQNINGKIIRFIDEIVEFDSVNTYKKIYTYKEQENDK